MKRVAFLGRGGHTIHSHRALLNKLSEDFEIIVFSEVAIQPEWLQPKHNYNIVDFRASYLPKKMRGILFLFKMIYEHVKNPFDLVHAHSTYPTGLAAVLIQKIFRVPSIVSLDGGEGVYISQSNFGDLNSRKRTFINKWVISQSSAVTVLTEFQHKLVCKNLNVKRPLITIVRGVDPQHFPFIGKVSIKEPIVFLSVGYLIGIKNPEMLLRTFQIIQKNLDCSLIHIGKDYLDGATYNLAVKLGVEKKIKFLGFKEWDDLKKYYESADILLHTSNFESQGMVVAEALSSGLLVCGTKVGLMSDLPDICVTVPPYDAEALAESVLELVRDDERMKRLQYLGHQWSQNHSLHNTFEKFKDLYNGLIANQIPNR